jgi:hypothetical protein
MASNCTKGQPLRPLFLLVNLGMGYIYMYTFLGEESQNWT